jgi:c-di-GMP-binding flagellar brake protein YcgR
MAENKDSLGRDEDETYGEASLEEKRRHYRLNRNLSAEFFFEDDAKPKRIFVVDVSAGGFRITTTEHFPKNRDFVMALYISKEDPPIRAVVQVAWARELTLPEMYEVGFTFKNIEPHDFDRLARFIVQERARSERRPVTKLNFETGLLNRPLSGGI